MVLGTIGGIYVLLIVGLIVADVAYIATGDAGSDILATSWAQ